ncbi:Fc.00g055730.m01.CDS01, partial [Cosmosporella sp. VM-42]
MDEGGKIATACDACRLQKRKCDKAHPKCSQCTIRSRECVYAGRRRRKPHAATKQTEAAFDADQNPSPTRAQTWCGRSYNSGDADQLWTPRVEFPAIFFLDRHVFQQNRVNVPAIGQVTAGFPIHYLGLTQAEEDSYVSSFFHGAHKWLPVVSEERFRSRLEKPRAELPADIALLLLCMKLISWIPSTPREDACTEIYCAAKQGFANLEFAGILSAECLEAGLLISLYEIGHAIYPAAYLSVGTCLRYGNALGLGGPGALRLRRPLNRVEMEENKRLWCGIILLD